VEGWLGARHKLGDVAQKKKIRKLQAGNEMFFLRNFGLITARTGENRFFSLNDTCEYEITF